MFSKKEIETLQNTEFFHLKKSITEKMITQLNELKVQIQQSKIHQSFDYPMKMDASLGKISKGENYKGLPYLMLDFPRLFSKEGIFAFRTMFWWGKGCFCTLHLSGVYLDVYKNRWLDNFEQFQNADLFFYKNAEEIWSHEVEKPHYEPLKNLTKSDVEKWINQNNFIKIAAKLHIQDIHQIVEFGVENFDKIFFYFSPIEAPFQPFYNYFGSV